MTAYWNHRESCKCQMDPANRSAQPRKRDLQPSISCTELLLEMKSVKRPCRKALLLFVIYLFPNADKQPLLLKASCQEVNTS